MTTQESYVKLTMNSDGKVQPELFISGELNVLDSVEKFNNLVKEVKKKYVVPEDEVSHEVKQMSGWKQITVRSNDITKVIETFKKLSDESTFSIEVE